MKVFESINFHDLKTKFQVKKPWDDVLIFVLNILIAIPLFIIVHQNLIDPDCPFDIDRILMGVIIISLIQLILRLI